MFKAYLKNNIIKGIMAMIGLAIIVVLIFTAARIYRQLKTPTSPIYNAIPQTAGMILEIKNVPHFLKAMRDIETFWDGLKSIKPFKKLNNQIYFLDSLIHENKDFKNLAENTPLVISIHPSGSDKARFLMLSETTRTRGSAQLESLLQNFLDDHTDMEKGSFGGVDVFELKVNDNNYFFASYRGLIMGTASKSLLEDAIFQLKSEAHLNHMESFSKVSSTVGARVEGNLFINYQNIYRIILPYISDYYKPRLSLIADFAHWSGLDINMKGTALILNGFTEVPDTVPNYLNLFINQQPQRIEVTQLLPSNTPAFIHMGFSDFKKFNKAYKNKLNKTNRYTTYQKELESFEKLYGLDPQKYVIDNICSEIALAQTGDFTGKDPQTILFLRFKDTVLLNEMIRTVSRISKKSLLGSVEAENYRNFEIGHFNFPEIFNIVAGTDFNLNRNDIFTIVDNYLILAQSREDLINVINAHVFNRSLAKNPNYTQFSNLISGQSNMYVFFNVALAYQDFKMYLGAERTSHMDDFKSEYASLNGFAYQISKVPNGFYTNICFNYNPEPLEEEEFNVWEVALENTAGNIFMPVRNHNDNSLEIIVNDISNNLYLIDNKGFIVWKKEIEDRILGDVIQIDYYNNGNLQYLFNTAHTLYLIDRNGNNVAGYPHRLPQRATNGVAVFDYDNDKNYRLMLANDKNEILNLDKDANPVDGWHVLKTQYPVENPVQYIRLLNRDYLFVTDSNGQFYILNRRGEERVTPDQKYQKALNSKFYPIITPDRKGLFVTSLKDGSVLKIDLDGKTELEKFANFSQNHFFLLKDFNNNALYEYIFVDGNRLVAYDYTHNIIAEIPFSGSIQQKPIYFDDNVMHKLGLFSNEAQKVYAINNKFEISENFPLKATAIAIIKEQQQATQSLVIYAKDNMIYKIYLKE